MIAYKFTPAPLQLEKYLGAGTMLLWINAGIKSSLTIDGSNRISQINDLSSGKRTFTQGTQDNQATYSSFKSLPSILFDGSNDTYAISSNITVAQSASQTTFVSMVRVGSIGADNGVYGSNSFQVQQRTGIGTANGVVLIWFDSAGNNRSASNAGIMSLTNANLARFEKTPSQITARKNDGTATTQTPTSGEFTAATFSILGRNYTGSTTFYSGHLHSIVQYSTTLTTNHFNYMYTNYFKKRWNMS